MSRLKWLGLLMCVAIVVITGFQGYWLKENYNREKKALLLKTGVAFRETILELQVSKLNLGKLELRDSANGRLKVFVNNNVDRKVKLELQPREKIVSTINVISSKMRDSLKSIPPSPEKVIISVDGTLHDSGETVNIQRHLPPPPGKGDRFFNLLYGVDSLQDSLKLPEIYAAYSGKLKEEKINIPFTIDKLDSISPEDDVNLEQVTVGIVKPVTYQVNPGNITPYLIKRITLPILFSLVLIGITLLSFLLLYRNMLKQKRLAELKNEFISNITHELKTPIATVGVAIEALKNFNAMNDPAKTREYLDISSNELQRLGFLVDKVLKLSMFEKKEVDLKYERVDLRQLIEEVRDSMKLQLEKYHASFDITQEGSAVLEGDRLHLLSVIFNLLDNALKYGNDAPKIRVTLVEKVNDIEMKFADDGIGIPPDYREKVFEKFFRVPQGNIHNAKGYGLGLSYAAEVIRKHKGSIRAVSNEGKGTTFIVSIPKKEA